MGLEKIWKGAVMALFNILSAILHGGSEENTGNVSQNDGGSNWTPPKYKPEALLLESPCSVM